jgi:hypothetical protein
VIVCGRMIFASVGYRGLVLACTGWVETGRLHLFGVCLFRFSLD